MSKKKTSKPMMEVEDFWRGELTKLRCWLEGYKAGKSFPGSIEPTIPGFLIIRQLIMAIDKAKSGKDDC